MLDTPTDMSCYTPEPEERSTALSPMPEIPSDPREILPGLIVASLEEPVTECMLGVLEPSPLNPIPPHPVMSDDQSLPATLRPSLTTNETPRPLDDDFEGQDPWSALCSFQDRLLVLHQTLEQSMSDYTSPLDD